MKDGGLFIEKESEERELVFFECETFCLCTRNFAASIIHDFIKSKHHPCEIDYIIIILKINYFIFGYTGSSLLRAVFLWLWCVGFSSRWLLLLGMWGLEWGLQ